MHASKKNILRLTLHLSRPILNSGKSVFQNNPGSSLVLLTHSRFFANKSSSPSSPSSSSFFSWPNMFAVPDWGPGSINQPDEPGPNENRMCEEMVEAFKEFSFKVYSPEDTKRNAHAKTLAILRGVLTIDPDHISKKARVGLFSKASKHDCWVRFSNSSPFVQSDGTTDVRGIAIKLMENIDEKKSLGQDFIGVTTPTMPLGTVRFFYVAIYYIIMKKSPIGFAWRMFVTGNIFRLWELYQATSHPTSLLDIPFWSITPFKLGDKEVVKYKFVPSAPPKFDSPKPLTPHYLSDRLEKHLNEEDACFDLCVQFRTHPSKMPIEDSAVLWSEKDSPFEKVATLVIPKQKFRTPENAELGEVLAFSPTRTWPEHEALGGLNRARGLVYDKMAHFRHERAGRGEIC